MKRFSNVLHFAPAMICVGLMALYASVIPSEFTIANNSADGGDFLSAILTDGIPHPTGYPTYLLIGKLFQFIPGGSPFFKGALLSLFFSTAAVALLMYLMELVLGENSNVKILGVCIAGITLGTCPLFWSQAVVVEVYGLQSFFTVSFILWLFLLLQESAAADRDIGLSFLSIIIGLGIGNHLTTVLIFPAALFVVVIAVRRGFPKKNILKYVGLIATAGISIYISLPLRARLYPPVNWGNPQTLEGFFWLVSGEVYQNLMFGPQLATYVQRIGYWARLLLEQFGVPGLFLGVVGAVKSFSSQHLSRWVTLWIFFIYSIFSISYMTYDSTVYLIPTIIIFSIWVGMAVKEIWNLSSGKYPWGKVLVVIFFFFLLLRLPSIRQEVDPRRENAARTFAENCLNSLPQNALMITSSDVDTFSLWYYHFGLGRRPDVRIVVRGLAGFDWYQQTMQHTYPDITLSGSDLENLEKELSDLNPGRPVCKSWQDLSTSKVYNFVCLNNE